MKVGQSCWGRYGDWDGDALVAWEAVTARLWAKTSDADLDEKIASYRQEVATATGNIAKLAAEAGLRVCLDERAKRAALKGEVV